MKALEVLKTLKQHGNPNTATIYARHGVVEETFGVPYAALSKLVKKVDPDEELALDLWASQNHDARVLATKVVPLSAVTPELLSSWLGDCSNYVINDAISALAARLPGAEKLAMRWMRSSDEWVSAAGWNVIAILATDGRLPTPSARKLLGRIRKGIARAKNRTRHSMNNALIAIGGSNDELTHEALDVARGIGAVDVDHGKTGCKTPDAASYISKMVERNAAKRTRITGARMRSSGATKQGKRPGRRAKT